MRKSRAVASREPTGYGYGVGLATFAEERKFTHSGGIPGFTSVLSYYPAYDLTITVLMNTGFANPWAVDSEVVRIVLGLPSPESPPIHLSSEELENYAGTYLIGSQALEVVTVGDRLDWLGQRFHPIGEHVFQCIDDPECTFSFTAIQRVSSEP